MNDEFIPTSDDMGFSMVAWSHLGLGLGSGQFNEGLPKGSRLTLDRDAWLRRILTEWIIIK